MRFHPNGAITDVHQRVERLTGYLRKEHLEYKTILHSDQGSVYASRAFNALLPMYGVTRSLSRGTPMGNAAMEAINGWIKTEMFMDFRVTGEMPVEKEVDELHNILQ